MLLISSFKSLIVFTLPLGEKYPFLLIPLGDHKGNDKDALLTLEPGAGILNMYLNECINEWMNKPIISHFLNHWRMPLVIND